MNNLFQTLGLSESAFKAHLMLADTTVQEKLSITPPRKRERDLILYFGDLLMSIHTSGSWNREPMLVTPAHTKICPGHLGQGTILEEDTLHFFRKGGTIFNMVAIHISTSLRMSKDNTSSIFFSLSFLQSF